MATKKYYVTVDDAGTTRWYKDAKCKVSHRENGPAVEWANGDKLWRQNGQLHRENGPAIEWLTGDKQWYQEGRRHRTNGPAVVYADGTKEWRQHGQVHRVDGPAIEWCNGSLEWWRHDQLHRIDGPAIIFEDGDKYWYINGVRMTEAEFLAATQQVVEMTVADVEKLLGKRVKIIK